MEIIDEILADRTEYLDKLKSLTDRTNKIKIITGIRHCGKSKLVRLLLDELIREEGVDEEDDEQFIYINLDDGLITQEIGMNYNKGRLMNSKKLLEYIVNRLIPDKMNYIFIDEIQLLSNWYSVASSLRTMKNTDVYLISSNASIFSKNPKYSEEEYVEINILPLSFKEYYNAYLKINNKAQDYSLEEMFKKYITESGFPHVLNIQELSLIQYYLQNTIYLSAIQKDLVKKFNLSDRKKLDILIQFLFYNIGDELTLKIIEAELKKVKIKLSKPTINRYLDGLVDCYLLSKCYRSDLKGIRKYRNRAKYYVVDLGLRNAVTKENVDDYDYVLENAVYLELIRRGYSVTSGEITQKQRINNETVYNHISIDFIAEKNNIQEYYQIAPISSDINVLLSELNRLEEVEQNCSKYLLTTDVSLGEYEGVNIINIYEWLLGNNCDKFKIGN